MPKRKKRGNSKVSVGSLARNMSLVISEVKLYNQELHTRLNDLRNEMETEFEQLCRHIDGVIKRHLTLDKEKEG